MLGRDAGLFRSRKSIVGGEVHFFPLSVDDFFTNLRGGFPLLRFTVGEGCFFLAQDAMSSVIIGKTIQQALVAHFFVAAAIARLLIQHRFHFRRERVDVSSLRVRKLRRIERVGERSFGWLRVVGGYFGFQKLRCGTWSRSGRRGWSRL